MKYFLIYSYSLYHELSEYIFIFKIFIVYRLLIEVEIIILYIAFNNAYTCNAYTKRMH